MVTASLNNGPFHLDVFIQHQKTKVEREAPVKLGKAQACFKSSLPERVKFLSQCHQIFKLPGPEPALEHSQGQ